jgi:hypothetical protein
LQPKTAALARFKVETGAASHAFGGLHHDRQANACAAKFLFRMNASEKFEQAMSVPEAKEVFIRSMEVMLAA